MMLAVVHQAVGYGAWLSWCEKHVRDGTGQTALPHALQHVSTDASAGRLTGAENTRAVRPEPIATAVCTARSTREGQRCIQRVPSEGSRREQSSRTGILCRGLV